MFWMGTVLGGDPGLCGAGPKSKHPWVPLFAAVYAQKSRIEFRPSWFRNQIPDEPLLPRGLLPRLYNCLGNTIVAFQSGLNLSQLNAEAANLYLVVHASQKLQIAVRCPGHQITGAVKAASRVLPEWIGKKPFCR